MMSFSVNTNGGALIALQNLTTTEGALAKAQSQVSTGLAVATAADNGAVWAIAQNQRGNSSALDSVKQSLQRVQSTVDVATSAGSSVSDLLNQLRSTTLSATDTSLDATSRSALNTQFQQLVKQIQNVVTNASFNGTNLLNNSVTNLQALASSDGTQHLTVGAQNLSISTGAAPSGQITFTGGTTISTATAATNALALINTSITNVNNSLASLGSASNSLTSQLSFVGNLQDTLDQGVGNLVDANLAKESAQLQALQTKQSLGIQALSIANSSTSSLLSLFR
ncbi:flagellin [Phenylobacterium montanum]|uniref:Flagellin n=1 Tax=Phenylobacterium montanum TaxID=2823693 RepID=A0A975G5H8_9CAUL|nr:flagellin [Caulobacter sp. S6]